MPIFYNINMKKRYIFILLFAVACLALVSCGDVVTPSTTTTSTFTTTSTTSIPTTSQTTSTTATSTSKNGGNMELPWV